VLKLFLRYKIKITQNILHSSPVLQLLTCKQYLQILTSKVKAEKPLMYRHAPNGVLFVEEYTYLFIDEEPGVEIEFLHSIIMQVCNTMSWS
jgi:hypothetical protein